MNNLLMKTYLCKILSLLQVSCGGSTYLWIFPKMNSDKKDLFPLPPDAAMLLLFTSNPSPHFPRIH